MKTRIQGDLPSCESLEEFQNAHMRRSPLMSPDFMLCFEFPFAFGAGKIFESCIRGCQQYHRMLISSIRYMLIDNIVYSF